MLYRFCFFIFFSSCYFNAAQANEHCLSQQQQLNKIIEWAVVARVVDGDTLHLEDGRKLRLIGIDTPEIGYHGKASQPFSKKARKLVKQLLSSNKRVGLSYDQDKKDRYKRWLVYVNLEDGRSIEQILLKKGLAQSLIIPPNDLRINCYRTIEQKARDQRLGIWQLPENQWLDVKNISRKTKGLRFITGTVVAYHESHKNSYLKLTNRISIRIAKKDQGYFAGVNLKELVGQVVKVRGWLKHRTISVRTAYDLQVVLTSLIRL